MTDLIMEELNIKSVVFEKNLDTFMDFSLKPNFKVAGPVLGSLLKPFGAAVAALDPKETVALLEKDGQIELVIASQPNAIAGQPDAAQPIVIEKDLIDVKISAKEGFAVAMENNVFVILDTTLTDELVSEGLAREFVSKIQQMRKQKDFDMSDRIRIYYQADDAVSAAMEAHGDYIMKETLALELQKRDGLTEYDLNGHKTGLDVERT
jgi:isoleucyl-tRNA synthetase